MIEVSGFTVLVAVNILTAVLFVVSLRYNFKLGLTILNVQDSIEDSLDILDERYAAISKIAETPVFFDSMEIRQVISDIEASRDAVLLVANNLMELNSKNDDTVQE